MRRIPILWLQLVVIAWALVLSGVAISRRDWYAVALIWLVAAFTAINALARIKRP